jgi:magnesium transporter
VAQSYLRRLNEINQIVERLEDRLQRSQHNREVLELLRYQKSLVHFTNSLNGNGLIMDRLSRGELLKLQREEQRLLDDVTIEHRQAIGQVEIANDILSNMMDAFASIISNNLNTVMKLLTSLTVVLIVSTLIATFYGMNVPLPLEDERWAFPVLVGVSLLSAVVTAFIFWKKDWL